jgi:anti-sigma B factor antagonist
MKLTKKEIRGVVVVEIHGKLIGGAESSDEFHAFIKALLDDGKNRIVINLGRTSFADSRGIGMLIGAYTSVKNAGGDLVLSRVIDRINSILSVTRILLIFRTFDSDDEAVDYLEKGS